MINLPNNNDDVHLLTGAYVLNALDDVERRRFEQHLASCASCQDEVESLRVTVDDLAGAASEEPPLSLKASVLTEVGRTRQVSSVRGRSRSGATFGRLASAAAIVAALGLGGFALQQRSRAYTYKTAAEIVRAPDARIIRLTGATGSAQLTYAPSVGSGVLVTEGLAAAPTGRTYQAWAIEDGTPRSLGTFTVAASRSGSVRVRSVPAAGAIVAVTEEPAGGSPQPTSTPLLASA
jgi:anti-sigma-K factor RskA